MKDDQKALFVCVNKQDKIIGYKTRYDCHHNKDIIHRGVDIVLFNKKKDRILLQKRSKNKDTYPGLLTVSASGHVDKGESYKQAAYREMREELGIDRKTRVQLKQEEKYITQLTFESEMTMLFTGIYEGNISHAKDEIEAILYIKKEDLYTYREEMTPGCQAAFYKLGLL